MNNKTRVLLSLLFIVGVSGVNAFLLPTNTLMLGQIAGQQFQNSDSAYVGAMVGMSLFSRFFISSLFTVVVLLFIWYKPLKQVFATLAILLALGILPAHAYYDQHDYTEAVTIYPNETAFWIPDNGANKDSQTKFDSTEYYQANRIAVKRFIIPHTQLSGSGWGPWGNYYVPSGRLILVDRTPYNQEWTKDSHRGTSNRDESFPCQDNQGKDVTVEITIGTSVAEENAAKFLYNFGVNPPAGNRQEPAIVFTSTFYGRSLREVMPTVGRGIVQAAVCAQISTRDLDRVNAEAFQMMAAIREETSKAFIARGITLEYIGWAGTFSFSDEVQSAINRKYVAEQDQKIATLLQPLADTIQKLAVADAIRAFGAKTNGALPTTVVGLPIGIGPLMQSLLSSQANPVK